jgi:hypothetical protein
MISSRRMTSSGLVIIRAMIIIVPLVAALVLGAISILATVLNPVVSIPGMEDVPEILSTLTLVVLIRAVRYAAG